MRPEGIYVKTESCQLKRICVSFLPGEFPLGFFPVPLPQLNFGALHSI